jgi:hypothetical protein
MSKQLLIIGLFLIQSASMANNKLSGLDIAKKVDAVDDGRNSFIASSMTLVRGDKSKSRDFFTIRLDEKKNSIKSMIGFKSPKSIKNTSLLVHDDRSGSAKQWIFLPALKKDRKITGGSKGKAFVGSEVYYEDMEQRKPEDSKHKRLANVKLNGKAHYVIASIPQTESSYSRIKSWIDPSNWVPMKAEFYRGNKLHKTLLVKNVKKVQGIWTVLEVVFEKKSNGHKTILKNAKVRYNLKSIRSNLFTKKYLKKVSSIKVRD